ncbi:MAG: site-specific integrase [Alphaproteobacteria bacterium HGW-Alphaproteobacteria-16]|nr:MAG: site-specific integrase [Alphaproteobacteria bacterium HGW-Alphaproteobacteria-16]
MSVYRPKGSPWYHYDFVWKGRRYYGSTGMATKREASAFEAKQRHAAIMQQQTRPPITLDEACGLYAEHAEHLTSWPTVRYMLADLIAGLGGKALLSELTQRDLQQHVARRRATRSNATINRELDNARAVWRHAEKARFDIGEMPDWRALRLRVAETPPRELSGDEETALFADLRADMVDVVDFALKSGWRRAEVIGLRWADVDLSAMQAQTRIKGGDTVRRPLTTGLAAIVRRQPKCGPFVFTYVAERTRPGFIDKRGRKQPARIKGERYPMSATALRGAWAAAKTAAGIEAFRFHDLRHTRGTRIVRATGSLAAAKAALKHRSLKTTLRYAHVLDDDIRNALEASESRTIPEMPNEKSQKA